MKVLLVDDDAAIREALGQTLELGGYQAITARAFIEAKDHISRNFNGVIVSDVRMPGRDGFHLLAHVREVDPDLPVILLTGEADVPMAVQGMSGGAFGFLEKPCSSQALLEILERACAARQAVLKQRAEQKSLAKAQSDHSQPAPMRHQLEEVECRILTETLRRFGGQASASAAALGMPRKTFYDRLQRFGLKPEDFRDS